MFDFGKSRIRRRKIPDIVGVKKIDPDSSQWYLVEGKEAMSAN